MTVNVTESFRVVDCLMRFIHQQTVQIKHSQGKALLYIVEVGTGVYHRRCVVTFHFHLMMLSLLYLLVHPLRLSDDFPKLAGTSPLLKVPYFTPNHSYDRINSPITVYPPSDRILRSRRLQRLVSILRPSAPLTHMHPGDPTSFSRPATHEQRPICRLLLSEPCTVPKVPRHGTSDCGGR